MLKIYEAKKTISVPFLIQFERFIQHSISGRRRSASGKRVSKGTIAGYKYVALLLREYELSSGIELRVCLLHRASLQVLKREKNYWLRFFNSFSDFLYRKKGYYDNYIAGVFKIIKTFFNYLQNEKGLVVGNFHKRFRIPVQQNLPVVLSPEQLQFLIANKEFDSNLSTSLRRAKDIFVFGCTVGLRVSDLMNLKKSNLIFSENSTFLSVITKKTGVEIRIPLPEYVLTIIDRNKKTTGKFLLPRLSVTNLNIQIKVLIKKAGWAWLQPKYISRNGKMIELKTNSGTSWPFYRHITAHTMRRTAITTMLILGVSEQVVRKMSGHAPGSKEFYKYIGLAQDYINQELSKAYSKLSTTPAT